MWWIALTRFPFLNWTLSRTIKHIPNLPESKEFLSQLEQSVFEETNHSQYLCVINRISSMIKELLPCVAAPPRISFSGVYFWGSVTACFLNSAYFRFHKFLVTHWAANFDLRLSQPTEAIAATWQMNDGGKRLQGGCWGRDGQRALVIVCAASGGFYYKGSLHLLVIK